MDFSQIFLNLGEFFKKLFSSMSEVMTWLLTPTTIGSWTVAPIILISGGFLIAGVLAVIIR